MKIVSVSYSNSSEYSDPQKWLERISFYTGILAELARDHEVHSIERINWEGDITSSAVQYHFIRIKGRVTRLPVKIHKCIRAINPDFVLVNGMNFPIQLLQLKKYLAPKAGILVIHRAERPMKGLKRLLQRYAARITDAYLFSTALHAQEWERAGIIPKAAKTIEILQVSSIFKKVNKDAARRQLQISKRRVFLFVGNLNENKDPLTVARAFLLHARQYPDSILYIVFQTGELLPELKSIAAGSASIVIIGKVAHEDLGTWFSAADYLISGSHREAAGLAVIEAMSCGCIPILTSIPSFRRIAGGTGIFFEAGNLESLCASLRQTETEDMAVLSNNCISRFTDELSFPAIARQMNSCFEKLGTSRQLTSSRINF
jgi:glycosyltransferase involved in cell wall biosynthesis